MIFTRKPAQSFKIPLQTSPNLGASGGEIPGESPIEVVVTQVRGKQVKLGIQAHPNLLILREELDFKPRNKNEKPSD